MNIIINTILSAFIFLCCLINYAWANIPELQFNISNKPIKKITLNKLKSELEVHEITFVDPHYSKAKRYLAFQIHDVLQLAFGDKWKNDAYSDAAFTALDGYNAISNVSKLKEKGGYLTFHDVDENGWELIGQGQSYPGPFYLVWTGEKQTVEHAFPWTWQLASINLIHFEEQYPAVYPSGGITTSSVFKGYKIFKSRCFQCHSMNQQGGKIGPDLNAPQSVVDYRPKTMLKAFIKQPSKFRYTQMPDHLDFSDQDLEALVDYLQHKSKFN